MENTLIKMNASNALEVSIFLMEFHLSANHAFLMPNA